MKKKKVISIILISILSLIIIALGIVFIYVSNAIKPVRNIDVSLTNKEQNYSEIYDANGEPLSYIENLKNNYIKLDEITENTKQAFLSIEDKEFYNHKGLNYKRIAKATLNNLKSHSLGEGASTITQQLVKNRFLTNEKTFDRKIKEAYLSKKLEATESKDKIFETYLNTIYFGNGAYGIGNASKTFFDKEPSELTLAESCILAGCIKSPNTYSPINNYDKAISRKNLVLKEMLEDKKITDEEYQNAKNEVINISKNNSFNTLNNVDLYTQFVLNEASEILNTNTYNVLHGGYKIYTNQNYKVQKILDEAINDKNNYHKNSYGNIADSLAMIIDNTNYSVIAVAGKSKYNLVNIKRQPGSLIKPILTFAPAINEGLINAKTQILDEKIDIDGYAPNNVGNHFYDYISVEDAVAKSLNIPTIKITQSLGLQKCKNYAKKAGIEFNENEDNGYAIALGGLTDGVTLKDITDSYSTLTNNGKYVKSGFIKKIINQNNMAIYSNKLSETYVFGDDTSYLMTDILKYSVKNGTSKKLSKFNFDIAGKTGTVAVKDTNLNTDAYSLAYTTKHTMSVWLGNYTMEQEFHLEGKNNGGTYATQIISQVFDNLYKESKPSNFQMPESVEEIIIDRKTLDENHIVVLGDNVPERYQEKCLVASRFKPIDKSNKFSFIEPFDFEIKTYKNSCEIVFDAKDYIDYSIYRESDNSPIIIKNIKNSNGETSFVDTSMEDNIKYKYYIKAKSNFSNAEYITNKKMASIKKEYKKIIENENNSSDKISWLFA